MPCPMRPRPHTSTFLISTSLPPVSNFERREPTYMGLVATEDRGSVRHVVMTRAEKRNAMNGEMVQALGEAFRDAAYDDSVHVVVVRGDGPMFSSGMDIASLADLSDQPHMLRPFRRECITAWNLLEEMPKQTICQIHGGCIGGAMGGGAARDQ